MRRLAKKWGLIIIALFSFSSCNQSGNDPVADAVSQICNTVSGMEAIYWDLSNGIIRTDLPGILNIDNIGGVYFHPNYPPLSYNYPVGWTPETLATSSVVGMNLIRNDDLAIWRWVGGTGVTGITAQEVRDAELSALLAFFGQTNFETICVYELVTVPVSGIEIRTSNIMVRTGNFTGVIITSVTSGDLLLAPHVAIQLKAGPTREFETLAYDIFLGIEFQLLYGTEPPLDSDNDGTPDYLDNFPYNPNKT